MPALDPPGNIQLLPQGGPVRRQPNWEESLESITELIFQAHQLKRIHRTGYQFLGPGRESVAEHTFATIFIAYVMAQINPRVNALRLLSMCLIHDLPEARTGDLNYVQKRYVTADEDRAMAESVATLPFGRKMTDIISEFRKGQSMEAKLAHDADQLSFVVELKFLLEMGFATPEKWISSVVQRLKTPTGKKMADAIMATPLDGWWQKIFLDKPKRKK
jgi:putative hydrolases of HD superfamily